MKYRLPNESEKSAYVEKKFDEIAKHYDIFNDLITFGMHRYWKHLVARQTALRPGEQCLDLCCGTGDIARAVQKLQPQARVTALDFSDKMLSIANPRDGNSSGSICYLRADAMAPPFPGNLFDAVTVGFGLRNVPNLHSCLQVILRLLKPKGILVCLDVGKVQLPIIAELNRFYFFHVIPKIGQLLMPGQEMFEYLPYSSLEYPEQEELKLQMLEIGFQKVDVHNFVFGSSCIHVAYKSKSADNA